MKKSLPVNSSFHPSSFNFGINNLPFPPYKPPISVSSIKIKHLSDNLSFAVKYASTCFSANLVFITTSHASKNNKSIFLLKTIF